MFIFTPKTCVNFRKCRGPVKLLSDLSRQGLQFQHPGPQIRVVVIEMAEFPLSGVGAEPAAAPVGEVIDRRKQPRLPAELLCVLFRIAILVQQGNTASVQPEQPLLLIPGDADE